MEQSSRHMDALIQLNRNIQKEAMEKEVFNNLKLRIFPYLSYADTHTPSRHRHYSQG